MGVVDSGATDAGAEGWRDEQKCTQEEEEEHTVIVIRRHS